MSEHPAGTCPSCVALREQLDSAQDDLDILTAQLDRLLALKIRRLQYEPGRLEVTAENWFIYYIAEALTGFFLEVGGYNSFEMQLTPKGEAGAQVGPLILRLERLLGKSASAALAEARAALDRIAVLAREDDATPARKVELLARVGEASRAWLAANPLPVTVECPACGGTGQEENGVPAGPGETVCAKCFGHRWVRVEGQFPAVQVLGEGFVPGRVED